MSWRASAYIKALVVCPNGERISRTEKLVALVLADSHQDKGKAYTFPAVKMIAEDSLMDPRVCRRVLASLERKRVIERERPEHQGSGQLTFYRFPALDGKAARMQDSLAVDTEEKGGHDVLLSEPDFLGKRRTEGGRKEDKTASPSYGVTGTETKKLTPPNPLASEGEACAEFTTEQLAHIERLRAANQRADAAMWESYYCEQNCKAAEDAKEEAAKAKRLEELKRILPDEPSAVKWVMRECGFVGDDRKRGLQSVIAAVIAQEHARGRPLEDVAPEMVAAWRDYDRIGDLLAVQYGPLKFYRHGIWARRNSWRIDERKRERAQARVGS